MPEKSERDSFTKKIEERDKELTRREEQTKIETPKPSGGQQSDGSQQGGGGQKSDSG